MLFDFLRRNSLLTHGFVGWWWARRHAYPGDEHAVRVPVYGWVDAEVAAAAERADRTGSQATQLAPGVGPTTEAGMPLPRTDDRIATFPTRT